MSDSISWEWLYNECLKIQCDKNERYFDIDDVRKLIVKAPPVKQDISGDQPERSAICWWVESNYNGYDECGVCGCEFTSKSSNYCPRCGVKFTDHKRK